MYTLKLCYESQLSFRENLSVWIFSQINIKWKYLKKKKLTKYYVGSSDEYCQPVSHLHLDGVLRIIRSTQNSLGLDLQWFAIKFILNLTCSISWLICWAEFRARTHNFLLQIITSTDYTRAPAPTSIYEYISDRYNFMRFLIIIIWIYLHTTLLASIHNRKTISWTQCNWVNLHSNNTHINHTQKLLIFCILCSIEDQW